AMAGIGIIPGLLIAASIIFTHASTEGSGNYRSGSSGGPMSDEPGSGVIAYKNGVAIKRYAKKLPKGELESLDGVTLRLRLNAHKELTLGGIRPSLKLSRAPERCLAEADIEEGFVVTARLYTAGSDSPPEEFNFCRLIDADTGKIVSTWCTSINSRTFDKIVSEHPRLELKGYHLNKEDGALQFGGRSWGTFGKYRGAKIDVYLENGLVTKVSIYKDGPGNPPEDVVFIQAVDVDSGKMIRTWWDYLKAPTFRKLCEQYPRLVIKNVRLTAGSLLQFGGKEWARFTGYPNRLVDAEIEDGFMTGVRVYEDDARPVFEDLPFARLVVKTENIDQEKIIYTWYGQITSKIFEELARKYPKMVLKTRLNRWGSLNFAPGELKINLVQFAGYESEVEFDNGNASAMYLVWYENGVKIRSRVGPGYGRIKRRFLPKEEAFRNDLYEGLVANGLVRSISDLASDTLLRLNRGSMDILVKHGLVDERMRDGLAELDMSKIDLKDLADRLKKNFHRYEELGFTGSDIDRILRLRLIPADFLEYLQRRYHLGRFTRIISRALQVSNIEFCVKYVRDLFDKRGTFNKRRHLSLYGPHKVWLAGKEARQTILEKLKRHKD
ncbi:MAG TPA: hypothetical protein PLV52_05700, partial [Candidatus Omnitrophota bacterium]|nr:hypothetical protein [Candidatus Omnitrophota bacterium]